MSQMNIQFVCIVVSDVYVNDLKCIHRLDTLFNGSLPLCEFKIV